MSFENLTIENSENNKVVKKIYDEIKLNAKVYNISSGDTIYAIAKNNSMNVDDLLLLNSIIGKSFLMRGKNPLIKAGDIVYIPKNIDLFNSNLSKLREIKSIFDINEEITKSELNTLKLETNLYPRRVQSIGLPKILDGFIDSQEAEIDPRLPRIVDSGRETHVSCANLIRTLMAQSVNIGNLKNEEKIFLKKQNLDAWKLPDELMAIGYDQKFEELMSNFDKDKIGQLDPIANQKEYDKKIIELSNYLEKSGIPGSLVPFYFKFSKYKGVVADYNRRRPEDNKHYNTHQSMFAGNADLKFGAYEIKDYSVPGKILSFGGDKEKINKDIKDLSKEIIDDKVNLQKIKEKLLKSTDLSENEEMKKVDKTLNKGLSVATGGNQKKIDEIKTVLVATGDKSIIKSQTEKILKRKITEDDVSRLLALRKIYFSTYNSVLSINNNTKANQKISNISGKVESNAYIVSNINKYNELLTKISDDEKKLIELRESLKIEKKLTLVDYLANFIVSRLDYGPSAFTPESRKKVIDGIMKYNSMIHVKVDGRKILLDRESRNYQKGISTIFVRPESKIEISGAMMIDGEHQMNSGDNDRKEKMNSRTRFFFEFMVPQTYLATELLEPGKDSSFRKTDFKKDANKFSLKGVYDVRRGETVEKVLKEKIVIFENLNPKDPDFRKKLNYFYSLQIKALQLAGFLQDEQTINPGAFKINRVIPYYDTKNIDSVFSRYIKNKKIFINETQEKLRDLKKYVSVDTFPGDTEYHVYNRIIHNLNGANLDKYKAIESINDLNYFQRKKLISSLLSTGFYDKNGHIKSGKKLVVSFDKLNNEILKLSNERYISSPNLKEVDNFIIENVTNIKQNQDLMKNVLHNELYSADSNESIISRKFIKSKLETFGMVSSIGDYQIRINFLKAGWNEWLNKNTMNKLFNVLEYKTIRTKISSFSYDEQETIRDDLQKIKEIKKIVSKKDLSKDDFEKIHEILTDVMRLDSGDNSNYVGKIVSSVFMEEKLNNHYEKLAGILTYVGESSESIISNPEIQKNFEKMVILINNQGERNSFYAMSENYILRIIKGMGIQVDTKDVYDSSTKGKLLGKIDYGRGVFMEHFKYYITQINSQKISIYNENAKYLLEKLYVDLDMSKGNQDFINIIYKFFKNPAIESFLKEKNLSTSILPQDNEYNASDFQSSVFNYVNKANIK